jgi:hypothetical protein
MGSDADGVAVRGAAEQATTDRPSRNKSRGERMDARNHADEG